MKHFMFCLFAGLGLVLFLNGLGVMPELWSGRWWATLIGFALLATAFNPENGRDS